MPANPPFFPAPLCLIALTAGLACFKYLPKPVPVDGANTDASVVTDGRVRVPDVAADLDVAPLVDGRPAASEVADATGGDADGMVMKDAGTGNLRDALPDLERDAGPPDV